jgi:ATP-dependent protease ClpP protease subunit
MVGQIFINGQIGANPDEKGVNLIDVIAQVKNQPFATSFEVYINSEGGYVDVGFDIHDYLRSLKLPIKTIGVGLVASIATVIFMAGDERVLKEGTQFMIHLPSGAVEGNSEEIAYYNQLMQDTQNRLVKFYTNSLSLTEEAIIPLLRNETWLNSEKAFDLGFATEYSFHTNIVAKFEKLTKIDNKMTKEDKSWIESKFDEMTAKWFGKKPKNIILVDANGLEIEFPTVEDGQTPEVGDTAILDGQPVADGEYIMPSLGNAKVVFVGGAISEIIEEGAGDEDMEDLKAENEQLKTQLAEAQTLASANETAKIEAENQIKTIETEFKNFKAQVTAKINVAPKNKADEEGGEPVINYKAKLETLKTKKQKR